MAVGSYPMGSYCFVHKFWTKGDRLMDEWNGYPSICLVALNRMIPNMTSFDLIWPVTPNWAGGKFWNWYENWNLHQKEFLCGPTSPPSLVFLALLGAEIAGGHYTYPPRARNSQTLSIARGNALSSLALANDRSRFAHALDSHTRYRAVRRGELPALARARSAGTRPRVLQISSR